MSKCVPVNIIVLLNHWFSNSIALVCWNGVFSNPYTISAGVRQGEVLSPFLFACYVDNLILTLVNDGLGCHIGLQCMSVLMYADDLMLISGSLTQLQAMINACTAELEALDLTVNVRKSVCMRIGKSYNFNPSRLMSVNNCNIEWSDNLVYLGINVKSAAHFSVDLKTARAKFYRSFNAIYSKVSRANEYLIVSLVKSFCVPVIMYCLEALNLDKSSIRSIDNMFFNSLGKIFKSYDRNVLSCCLYYFNVLPLKLEYYNRRVNFLSKLKKNDNSCLKTCFLLFGKRGLASIYGNDGIIANRSGDMRADIWDYFVSNLQALQLI